MNLFLFSFLKTQTIYDNETNQRLLFFKNLTTSIFRAAARTIHPPRELIPFFLKKYFILRIVV